MYRKCKLVISMVLVLALLIPVIPFMATPVEAEEPVEGPANLVQNPGFEDVALTPWRTSPLTGIDLVRTTDIKWSGEASARFVPRDGAFSNMRQQITLKKGVQYEFSAWVRFEEAHISGNHLIMKLDYLNSTDPGYQVGGSSYPLLKQVNHVGTDWVKVKAVHMYEGDLDEVAVWLYFETTRDSKHTFYLDDVFVKEISTLNQIRNPGFERSALSPWRTSPLTGIDLVRDTTIQRSGEASASFTPRDSAFSNMRQQVTLKQDVEYTFSAWVRFDEAHAGGNDLIMKVDYHNSTDPTYKVGGSSYPLVERVDDIGTDWVKVQNTHTYEGNEEEVTAWLYFETTYDSQHRFYLDDVSVEEQAVPALIEVQGETILDVPVSGSKHYTYAADVRNQLGTSAGVVTESVLWSLEEPIPGAYLIDARDHSVTLAVGDDVQQGVAVLRATSVTNPTLYESKYILIGETEPVFLYVDPATGLDSNPGTEEAPFLTIERARDEIREEYFFQSSDVTVYLRGGEYNYAGRYTVRYAGEGELAYPVHTSDLTFDERDSGTNGFVVTYKAYPGERPVISGGKRITGWTQHDPVLNIYKANVGSGLDTRQLYVNGQRAVVARSEGAPADLTFEASFGHTTTDTSLSGWDRLEDIEFVYHSHWVEHRIKVHDITVDSGIASIEMKPDSWAYAVDTGIPSIKAAGDLKYFENAYELLDAEGEWYLDRSSGDIYYKPRSDENMATAELIIPVVDELLTAKGTDLDNRLRDMRFVGIAFEYAGWLRPNVMGAHHSNQNNTIREDNNRLPEAAVTVEMAQDIRFERNDFSKLGSTGLYMHGGIRDVEIIGNKFEEISGSAINVENPVTHYSRVSSNANWMLENIVIANNYIRAIGVEYLAATGISASLGKHIEIRHNEISEIPYTGIHMSWHNDGFSEHNTIENNYIHDLMATSIYDGGAIYTLGNNIGSLEHPAYTVQGNYIRNQLNLSGALFPDNRSNWWLAQNNVVDLKDSPEWHNGILPRLLHIHSVQSSNHRFIDNYATTDETMFAGTNNTVEQLHVYPDAVWPREAIGIIEHAGLEPGYQDLWNLDARFNRILNAGFETRQTNVWEAVYADWVPVTSEHHAGSTSAQVTASVDGGYLAQTIEALSGVQYQVSAWVKLDTGSNRNATLYAEAWEDGMSVRTTLDTGIVSSDGWALLEGQFVPSDDAIRAATKIYVLIEDIEDGDTYYLDEVRAVELNEVSVTDLQDAIAAAAALHDQAVEGDAPGEFAMGSKAELLAGIQDAENIVLTNPGPNVAYAALVVLLDHQYWFEQQMRPLVDRSLLGDRITTAAAVHDESDEGMLLGMVPPGSKADLYAEITAAELVYGDIEATVYEISVAYYTLEQATQQFVQSRYQLSDDYVEVLIDYTEDLLLSAEEGTAPGQYVPGSKNDLQMAMDVMSDQLELNRLATSTVKNMLLAPADWVNGTVELEPDQAKVRGRGVKYTDETWLDEMFEFDMTYTYTASGNDWPGFAIRSQLPHTTLGSNETSYVFLFKQEVWELQKWVDGEREMLIGALSGYTPRWSTIANTHIESGVQHRIRFGAENVMSGVRLLMMVDDEVVFDEIDEVDPISNAGYFSIYSTSNPITFGFSAMSQAQLEDTYQDWLDAIAIFEAAQVPK